MNGPSATPDPEWLSAWKNEAEVSAATLPQEEQYGIGIPALSPSRDPHFSGTLEYHVDASKGLELYTWKEALAEEDIAAILEGLLSSELLPKARSRLTALGRTGFESGLVVYVQPTLDDAGNATTETLRFDTTLPADDSADLLVVIGKTGSRLSATIASSGGAKETIVARTSIFLLEEDAHVEMTVHGETDGFVAHESVALVGPHSSLDWSEDPATAGAYRSQMTALLLGEGARSNIVHTVLAGGASAYDLSVDIEHRADHTRSSVAAVGAAAGESRIVYRGNIAMKSTVRETVGSQEGKFLVLSPSARVDAIPALDIASKHVTSSHKLSIAHVTPEDLFFAQTRGYTKEGAETLTVESFFGTLLERVKKGDMLPSLSERITRLCSRPSSTHHA